MGRLAKILGKYAPGHVLEHGGKAYTFLPMSNAQICGIEKALYKRDRDRIRGYYEDKEFDETDYKRFLAELRDKDEAGYYDLLGQAATRCFSTASGRHVLLSHVLGCSPDEATVLLRERTVECIELLQVVYFETFPDARKEALAKDVDEEGEQSLPPSGTKIG